MPRSIAYNKLINKAVISWMMLGGVSCTLVGTVLSVVFGAPAGGCNSVEKLESYWLEPAWWAYLIATLTIAVLALVVHLVYARRVRAAEAGQCDYPKGHAIVLPVTFTLYSALAGGAQMIVRLLRRPANDATPSAATSATPILCIPHAGPTFGTQVHSKVFSELLSFIFRGDMAVFTRCAATTACARRTRRCDSAPSTRIARRESRMTRKARNAKCACAFCVVLSRAR